MNDQRGLKVVVNPEPVPGSRLDSWKEIAAYLKRGARTVQRWEREEGLPVHRLQHEKLGSVYAYKTELDAWWKSRGEEIGKAGEPDAEAPGSIAVLPFADMSREKDQEYFCEGIAEEIINVLSRIRGMKVASRTSSFRFRTGGSDSREIGRRLGVRTLLEGSVRKAGEQLRIAVQLTDAENGFQLWAGKYDRRLRDIFAIQDEIARNVAEGLEVTLTPMESEALETPPTRHLGAHDCYLRGRKFYYQYSPRHMHFARQMFERAIELDPDYARAYAGLADCWSYIYLYSERTEAVRQKAADASRRAVEMDPESAQAQASRGLSLSLAGRNEEAERAFQTAIKLDSTLFEAHYFYARHCFALGRKEQAIRLYEEAMRVRPEDYQSRLLVAQSYDDLGRPEEARAARLRGVELVEQHLEFNPDDARAVYMAANGMVALGERERGREWAERARAMQPDDSMLLYNVGCIYSMLGMVDEAIDCLENAVSRGLTQKGWYLYDSNLDAVRDDPRFQRLVQSL